jgi:hypothetical protein
MPRIDLGGTRPSGFLPSAVTQQQPAGLVWMATSPGGNLSWLDSCNRFAKFLMLQMAFNSAPTS